MNKLEGFKMGASVVTGLGVFKIVGGVISTLVQQKNVIERVAVTAGQITLSLFVAETASKYIDKKTDDVIAWLDQSAKKNSEIE